MKRFSLVTALVLATAGVASANTDLVTRQIPAADILGAADLAAAGLRANDKVTVTTGLSEKVAAGTVLDNKQLSAWRLDAGDEVTVTVFDNGLRVETFER